MVTCARCARKCGRARRVVPDSVIAISQAASRDVRRGTAARERGWRPVANKVQKVAKVGLKKEPGYLYFVDKDGDISRAKMAPGGIPAATKKLGSERGPRAEPALLGDALSSPQTPGALHGKDENRPESPDVRRREEKPPRRPLTRSSLLRLVACAYFALALVACLYVPWEYERGLVRVKLGYSSIFGPPSRTSARRIAEALGWKKPSAANLLEVRVRLRAAAHVDFRLVVLELAALSAAAGLSVAVVLVRGAAPSQTIQSGETRAAAVPSGPFTRPSGPGSDARGNDAHPDGSHA